MGITFRPAYQDSFTKNILSLFLSTQAVDSKSGPGQTLRNALWNSKTTPDEVTLGNRYIPRLHLQEINQKDCYYFRCKCCGLTPCRLPGRVKRLTDGNCIIVLQLGLLGIQSITIHPNLELLLTWGTHCGELELFKLSIKKFLRCYIFFRTFYRLQLFRGSEMMIDSGNIEDHTHLGGRLGVFGFSQANIIWSNIQHKCSGKN